MPRITININAAGEELDQELLTLELPEGSTIADLKSFVEAETKFPIQSQHFYLNGQALRSDTQTLDQAGVKDGEMMALLVNRRSTQDQEQLRRLNPRQQVDRSEPDAARIEATRQRLLNDPASMTQLIQQQPALAQVVSDPARFRQTWMDLREAVEREQRERENQHRLLNDDPFNPDAQKQIEEMIRRERIEANRQYAYENNPAVFIPVYMLYVNVKVNGHPIRAFVDSGAQSTIMSPSCAEACNIHHLIDDRYAGIARGVGTAKILGRVHSAKIEIGDAELDCSFTVMEGKDVDLLFGLDMLRRHQACIDLKNNELRFPHTKVPFLGESEIPKRWEEQIADEPVVQGPNGTEIGAKTGTVRPSGSSAQAAEHLHNGEKGKEPEGQKTDGASSTKQTSANVASDSTGQARAQYPEKDIATLTSMGFSRQEAIGALDASGGNVEYAIGFLVG